MFLFQVESDLIGHEVGIEVSRLVEGGFVDRIYADATAQVFEGMQVKRHEASDKDHIAIWKRQTYLFY